MAKYRPLFVTGTARSGSNLLARMLSVNEDVVVACDPYFPLFRSLRNAILREKSKGGLFPTFDPASPLQDYYFKDEQIQIMDTIQASGLDVVYDEKEWAALYETSLARIELECADLAPSLDKLKASTYQEMFERGLEIIAEARGAENRRWVGFKEVWVVEFFAPLARALPDARFVILLRDPRAVAASMLAMGERDVSQYAHTLSYVRHCRKYFAFAAHYSDHTLFKDRLHILTYETLVSEPEKAARELCDFLEVNYTPAMLDADEYIDFSTGARWQGNSSFKQNLSSISAGQAERWRTSLNSKALKMVELVCGPEMKLGGYKLAAPAGEQALDSDALAYIIQNDKQPCSWRSDFRDPQQDYGFELFRQSLLDLPDRAVDASLVRRSFLFEDVFTRIRQRPVETIV